jgi:hypothetical protein
LSEKVLGAWRSAASTDRRPFKASLPNAYGNRQSLDDCLTMVLASRCVSAIIADNWAYFRAFQVVRVDFLIAGNEPVQNALSNQPFAVGSWRLSVVKKLDKIHSNPS